jgi:Glutaminase
MLRRSGKLIPSLYVLALVGVIAIVDACHKSSSEQKVTTPIGTSLIANDGRTETSVVSVAALRTSGDGSTTKVMFNQKEEIFNVGDATMIATLKDALANNKMVTVVTEPSSATLLKVSSSAKVAQRTSAPSAGDAARIDLTSMSDDHVNGLPSGMAILNTTTAGDSLTAVIPDMASAQLMFDYITHQCCANPGPYAIDYCITFQYCPDGCYARAHEMCWIINNKYHYATHKIFSFANAGSDELCVKAEKWGGCCINWWYHVAPLVNIKTAKGVQAYVFDPAMFDQPVLLATWLHAQENPACVPGGDVPHVSMINVQPTASFWPSDGTGYNFDDDPTFANTDTTLVHYRSLISCP